MDMTMRKNSDDNFTGMAFGRSGTIRLTRKSSSKGSFHQTPGSRRTSEKNLNFGYSYEILNFVLKISKPDETNI
jgi:hypothetical protein